MESRSSHQPSGCLWKSHQKRQCRIHDYPTLKTTCSFCTGYSKFLPGTREKSQKQLLRCLLEITQLQGPEAPAQWVGRKTPKEQEGPQGIRPQVQQVRPQREHTEFCFHWLLSPSACCPLQLCTAGQTSHLGTGTTNVVCANINLFKYHLCLRDQARILFHKLVRLNSAPSNVQCT